MLTILYDALQLSVKQTFGESEYRRAFVSTGTPLTDGLLKFKSRFISIIKAILSNGSLVVTGNNSSELLFALLGLLPGELLPFKKVKDDNIASLNKTDNQNSLGENKNLVPNLIGKSLKGAIQTVNSLGLKAIYDGDGIVVKQLPPAGRPFPASKILRIKLSSNISE